MYPNSVYVGLKVVPMEVLLGQGIYHLGTWTLGVQMQKNLRNQIDMLLVSLPVSAVHPGLDLSE